MKTILFLFASASLLITTNVASFAQSNTAVSLSDVASQHCGAEWERVSQLEANNAWTTLDPIEIDPEIDAATTVAVNKYTAAVVGIADYMTVFTGFSSETNQNQDYSDRARSKFDLMMCLFPQEAERDLILDLAMTTTNASENDIRAKLFTAFDQFECMQFAEASEAIFSVESFPFDYEAITTAHMKVCN
ncbi:MAG: hypothetical protein ABJN14_03750 [Paracoccaceae bacterium]